MTAICTVYQDAYVAAVCLYRFTHTHVHVHTDAHVRIPPHLMFVSMGHSCISSTCARAEWCDRQIEHTHKQASACVLMEAHRVTQSYAQIA